MTLHALLAPPVLLLMVVFPGLTLLTARLTRPDLFFSITVDSSLRESATGRAILRRFNRSVILASVLGLSLALIGVFADFASLTRVLLILGGALIETMGLIAAYARARRQVRPHQVEPSQEREVSHRARPMRPIGGWLGQAGPFLILGLAATVLWWRWDAIPERFPIHWDLYGRPNGWAIKSWHSVFGSLFIGALTCLLLAGLMIGLARGVRRIHSSGPDGEKESRFLRMMLWMILGLEYSLAVTLGFAPILPPWLSAIFVIGGLLVSIAITVVALRSGQGGWRLRGQTTPSTPGTQPRPVGDRTPDRCWKGGVIYYNPDDPAVWVEKRFGIGWTLNFGNSRAWIIMGVILVFAVAVPVLSVALMRK